MDELRLENDILLYRDQLDHHPPGHPDRPASLQDLADVLIIRYDQCRNTEDLENAISLYREVLALRPPGLSGRSRFLSDLAYALVRRYQVSENEQDMDCAIALFRKQLTSLPPDDPSRYTTFNAVGIILMCRYRRFGRVEDIEDCISAHRNALTLRPSGHPDRSDRSESLHNLGSALALQRDCFSKMEDLEECITVYQETLTLQPPGHPDRSLCLGSLADALMNRYEQLGKVEDMENAISFYRDALNLPVQPADDPSFYSALLNNLARTLMSRYDRFGKVEDAEDSISFYRDAVTLHSPGQPERSISLSSLAGGLKRQYQCSGKREHLENCVAVYREVLTLRPPGHTERGISLNNLARALMLQYNQFGKVEDMEECISCHRNALTLHPPGHPDRFLSLHDLATSLNSRYRLFGEIEDLEGSISFFRDAHTLFPFRQAGERSRYLNNLGSALLNRFALFGKIEDMEDGISFHHDALSLEPLDRPSRSVSLHSLAVAFMRRYEEFRKVEDLEKANSFYRDALTLHPPGRPEYSTILCDLAMGLRRLYAETGKVEDLKNCISMHRDALTLRPPGHPARYISLNNLAISLMTRHEQFDKIEDLEECISCLRDALTILPPGHSDRSASQHGLAYALIRRYRKLNKMEDFQETFICFEQAANDITSHLKFRLGAAKEWTKIARHFQHKSTLTAYTTLLQLLNRSMISRPTIESQHKFFASLYISRTVAADAASAAIQIGNLEVAVELLEQCRAMLWSEIGAYKYPLEQLRQVQGGAEFADRLETLSAQLEKLVLLSSNAPTLDNESPIGIPVFDTQTKQHRILSEEWEDLVGRIRKVEGFENFLHAPQFKALQSATAEGPVILVNISRYRSDAIILYNDNFPVLVTLPDVQPDELNDQIRKRTVGRETVGVLRYLWNNIVSPVVDCLSRLGVQKKSRVWWCPTAELCALPLHAAGPYRRGEPNAMDLYVFSYTSTLSSLIRARSNRSQSPTNPKLLVVGQPSEDLERVVLEVDAITKLSPPNSVNVLLRTEANCEAVLNGLKEHSWVHFACHGRLGPENNAQPFQASFELDGGRRLSLLDLIRARLPNAEFAFLSACHSAAGDLKTPDESIHLSAALQFCGFRSVVGTLWEMYDENGPMISEEFYRYMFRDPGRIDFRDSAHALNCTIRAMRKAKLPPERWVMFVHIGA